MAEPGKLRYRDGRLVVETTGGRVIAEVEPDDNMAIDAMGIVAGEFAKGAYGIGPLEGRVTVSWYQTIGDPGNFIDADAVEVDTTPGGTPEEVERLRRQLGAGDGEG